MAVEIKVLLPLLAFVTCLISLSNQFAEDNDVDSEYFDNEEDEFRAEMDTVYNGDELAKKGSPDSPPGEMGAPYVISNPSPEEQTLISRGYERNAYNEFASDFISVHRRLPDYRNDWCRKPGIYLPKLLPMSVIICFYNEGWSVLLRSIHSIIDRTAPELLTEIILVDDFSDHDHLQEKLEEYIAKIPQVKLVRATKREGLIRARMIGAANAKGPVLTFLDSHVEVTEGWAEPLLDRITRNKTTVVCPIIDVINDDTLEYKVSERSVTTVGGFTWDLIFTWKTATDEILRSLKTPADPVASPTMAGGLFSIHKKFFERVGQYDEEYEIWGAENLELSFKTWMCGGRLEIVPCSHVGHIYRKRSPYSHKVGKEFKLHRNLGRLAKVWLDDYAKYFFAKSGDDETDYGDISSRLALRKKLKCKSFSWFIKNVYPDIFNPKLAVGQGEIRNQAFGGMLCLDSPTYNMAEDIKGPVNSWPCHKQGGNQHWFYTKDGEVRRDEFCLDFADGPELFMYPCHSMKGNQVWRYEDETGFIIHVMTAKCLTLDTRDELSMQECQERITQRWKFGMYSEHNSKQLTPEVFQTTTKGPTNFGVEQVATTTSESYDEMTDF